MTCNPFGNLASKHSASVIKPDDIDADSMEDLFDFSTSSVNRFDDDTLTDGVNAMRGILDNTNLDDYPTLKEKNRQSKLTKEEFADFVEDSGSNIDDLVDLCKRENQKRKVSQRDPDEIRGVIDDISIEDYSRDNEPGIYDDIELGNGTKVNVTIGNDGRPLIDVINPGSGYNQGDIVDIPDLDISFSVDSTRTEDETIAEGEPEPFTPSTPMRNVLGQLDFFFDDNFGSSITNDFCSLFNSKILPLIAFATTVPALIDDVWDSEKGFQENVQSQISTIETLLHEVVDQITEKMKEKVENVANSIVSIGALSSGAFRALNRKMMDVREFFDDFNTDKIKGIVSRITKKLGDQFKELTIEVIEFILYRMCQVSDFLSNFMQKPVDDLTETANKYERTLNTFENYSDESRKKAVEAGAVRVEPKERRERAEDAAKNSNSSNSSEEIEPTKYLTMDFTERERKMLTELTDEGNEFVSFEPQVIEMHKRHPSRDPSENFAGAGWKMIVRRNPGVFIRLFRVAERMNVRFTINSAFRNLQYNRSVGSNDTSAHVSACAMDVRMAGIDRDKFIKYCSQEGFEGIGAYNTFIHVDVGSHGRRTWGGSNSQALSIHSRDGFRKGH